MSPEGHLYLYLDSYDRNNGTHQVNARVDFRAPFDDSLEPTIFEDVMLCLYDENGTVLNGTVIGDIETPEDEASATLSAQARPKYVVADHPRFSSYGKTDVQMLSDRDGAYYQVGEPADILSPEFEYPRYNETGRCM